MKKFLLIFSLLIGLSSTPGKAQVAFHIDFDTLSSIANDTFNLGGTVNYNVAVYNVGPAGFNTALAVDTLYINTAVRDSLTPAVLHTVSVSVISPPVIDSGSYLVVPLSTVFTPSASGFHKDINVIVIWPYALGATAIDSLEFNVFLLDPTGVNELDVTKYIHLYPNPTIGDVELKQDQQIGIESVRIFNLQGQLVAGYAHTPKVDTSDLAPGMYLVKVRLENGQETTLRLIRQ